MGKKTLIRRNFQQCFGAHCRLSLKAYSTVICHLSRLRRSRLKMTENLHWCTWSYTRVALRKYPLQVWIIAMASRIIKSGQDVGLRLDNSACSILGEPRAKVAEQYRRAENVKRPWIICFENFKALQLWDKLVAHWTGEKHPSSIRNNSSM